MTTNDEKTTGPFDDVQPPQFDDDEPLTSDALAGATLRDAFAAIALTQMEVRGMDAEACAVRCYEIADHMLLQRLK